jgi:hypothetical protein
MYSANTDPELSEWLHWASESGKVPVFVRMVAEVALLACSPDYALLRPVLVELKRRHPRAGCGNHETEWAPEGQPMPYHGTRHAPMPQAELASTKVLL